MGKINLFVLAILTWIMAVGVNYYPSSVKAQTTSFVFTAHGDHGEYNQSEFLKSLNTIRSISPAFSLALGDMNYEYVGAEQRWCSVIQQTLGSSYPFEILIGNHEDEDKVDGYIGNFIKYCSDRLSTTGLYGAEYYFDYPRTSPLARVIMIGAGNDWDYNGNGTLETVERFDYNQSNSANKVHYDWLANTIDSARSANIPWVIVGMHKNCITLGLKNCEIGEPLMNLLLDKKVDLVLQGHDHTYQRSKQLALSPGCSAITTNSINTSCVVDDGADNIYTKGAGSVFVITGHFGGGGFYTINPNDSEVGYFAKAMGGNGWYDFNSGSTPHTSISRGITKVTVKPQQLAISEINTSNLNSDFKDDFVITASSASPAPTSTPVSSPPSLGETKEFVALEDASIRQTSPNGTFGTNATLEVDAESQKDFLVKFNVSGLAGANVDKAKIMLYALDSSDKGGDIYTTGNNWSQSKVTWNSAPAKQGGVVSSLGQVSLGNWYEFDVTSVVTGEGEYNFRIETTSANGADYSSTEGIDGHKPKLIVTTSNTPASSCPELPLNTGVATMTVNANEGIYKVWSRMRGKGESNSYWLQIDDECAMNIGDKGVLENWTWVDYQDGSSLKYTTVKLGDGSHTFKMVGKEPGLQLDRLIVASDLFCIPTGTGENCLSIPTTPSPTPLSTPTPTATTRPTPTPTAQPPTAVPSGEIVLTPSDDATVRESSGDKNYGQDSKLESDGSSRKMIYLKFDLSGVQLSNISVAKLKLSVVDSSSEVQDVRTNDTLDWEEGKITYNNKPDMSSSPVVAKLQGGRSGSEVTIDLTNAVRDNSGKFITVRIEQDGSNGIDYSSKEGSSSPKLIITTN